MYRNKPTNFSKKVKNSNLKKSCAHLITDAVNIKKQACDILAEARDEDKISHVDQNTGFFDKFDFINFLSGYIWGHIALSYFFI
jgi:hypothetical protein